MKKLAISISRVSKKYYFRYGKPTMVEKILGRRRSEWFWALRDINLNINKGEKLGIVGSNGSGKTTLLEIIAGITRPTTGVVDVKGKIISLIGLEAGFYSELSGLENMLLNGLLVGMTRKEIAQRRSDIIAYADIGEFINAPFYTYSTGMKLRLAFSIAAHADFDTIILDENISVGDVKFMDKVNQKIQEFLKEEKTIIIATHSFGLLKKMCNRVIWLDSGKIKYEGATNKVIQRYLRS